MSGGGVGGDGEKRYEDEHGRLQVRRNGVRSGEAGDDGEVVAGSARLGDDGYADEDAYCARKSVGDGDEVRHDR
jgi:hypothetical protein